MSKWYGSVNNRIEEGHQFVKEIKVGDGMTEYLWSDRHAYEVTQVINQEHVFVRRMKATIKEGTSYYQQQYDYAQDLNEKEIELVKYRGNWCKLHIYNKERINKLVDKAFEEKRNWWGTKEQEYEFAVGMGHLTEKQREKFENGKTIKKYTPWKNISFGVMEEYEDPSF